VPDPTLREMLVAKVDELVGMTSRDLDEIRAVTDRLEPDRSQSCRVVLTMARVMLDEIRLRAAAGRSTNPDSEAYVPAAVGVATASGRSPGLPVPPGGPLRVCARPSEPRA
jgi:hypothetical protein